MKNYAKFLISLLLMFCFTNCVFAQTEENNSNNNYTLNL